MSLNEKFGRAGSNQRKVNIHDAPDTTLLQNLIADLSISTAAAQCDVTWGSGNDMYTLCLNHSRQAARASWKLYHGTTLPSNLLWAYDTNDISTVHKLVSDSIKRARPTQSQLSLTALQEPNANAEERRAININSNLSGKLRKLFIGTQEDVIAGRTHLEVEQKPYFNQETTARLPASSRSIESIDMKLGKEIMQQLFMGELGIFSYPTFLFFLEREYYDALENKTPISLVVFETIGDVKLSTPIWEEISKRIIRTQRKTDILAQYGTDKFAVLLPETNTSGAKSFIARVERAFSKEPLSENHSVSTSSFAFGVATLGEHCKTLSEFLSWTEAALQTAKETKSNIIFDHDIYTKENFKQPAHISVDLTPARQLVKRLISAGIFTYPAFLAFLEHEYYRASRKERDLLVILLKVRINEKTFDEPVNMLPPPEFYEVIRRIGVQLNKRDIFAHYGEGNFVIMRPSATANQMESFANKLVQHIMDDEWLTPECPVNSLKTFVQVCIARPHTTAANLFCLLPAH